jgi:predicted transcriptional regulator of viral defense system
VTPKTPARRTVLLLRGAGIARTRDLEGGGVSRKQLQRLYERGEIERIGRGLYALPGTVLTEKHSLAEACRRVPNGVVCLLSALRFHELTTQNPFEVWMAIDQKAWRPRNTNPRLRLVHLSGRAFHEGVEKHDVGGVPVRVFSAAKTVADCFKFRNKIGIDVAVEALRDFTRRYRGGANDLARFARICRVQRVMQPYLDSIS